MLKRCLFAVAVFAGLTLPLAASAASGIAPGYYTGLGDGALVVLHVYPNHQVIMGGIPVIGFNGEPYNPTEQEIHAAGMPGKGLSHTGKLVENEGKYVLSFSAKQYLPACQYNLKLMPKGIVLASDTQGCVHYHGANWGYGVGGSQPTVLTPYRFH